MRKRVYILGTILVFLVLVVGSCRKAGTWLVKADDPVHADLIVLLTGSFADRVLQVADNYGDGQAPAIWMVDDGNGTGGILEERGYTMISYCQQAKNALIALGVPEDRIEILPGGANSTRMEAEMIRDRLSPQTGIDTVLLVTSSSHSRRAFLLFDAAFHSLDDPPVLYSSPNSYTSFNAKKWWKNKNDIHEVVFEYLKLVNFVLFERGKLRRTER